MTPNLDSLRKGDLARAGSFWSEQIVPEQRDLIRTLMKMFSMESASASLHGLSSSLSGSRWVDVWNLDIKYSSDSNLVIGCKLDQREDTPYDPTGYPIPRVIKEDLVTTIVIDGNNTNFWTEGEIPIVVPFGEDKTEWYSLNYATCAYFVPVSDVRVNILLSHKGWLFSGLDFFNTKDGVVLREDPSELFPNGFLHVKHGWRLGSTPYSYTLSIDPTDSDGRGATRYLRTTGSILDLETALNEVLGMDSFPDNGVVLGYHVTEEGVLYEIGDTIVRINQPHDPIPTGHSVVRGQVPNKVVHIFSKVTHGDKWYNYFHVPVNGLPASRLIHLASDTDRVPAGRLAVSLEEGLYKIEIGSSSEVQDLMDHLRRQSLDENPTFNEYIGDNSDGDVFDLVTFLLENVWNENGMCVMMDSQRMSTSDQGRVRDFLYRNHPINAVSFELII